ncbi:MAG: sugar ABC transporter permease [Clostridia bacterium]|nr:sugar ABC transporter permease [Clostridia bacterium]
MKARKITALTIIHIILTVLAIIWVLPFGYVFIHSFRGNDINVPFPQTVFPTEWTLDAWSKMFGGNPEAYSDARFDWINFPRWFGNTLLIACCCCVLTTFMTLATSYAFSRMRFRLRQPYMKLILILGMFPGFLGMIAVYNILRALGLNEGWLKIVALIFVYSGGAGMGYYISKGFFDTIPKGLDEAAKLDGASQAQIFFKITLPLSKPIIVYTALTAFMAPWMDFIFVKLICAGQYDYGTVSLGLQTMLEQGNYMSHWILFCVGATMVAVPITILFMFLQKYYVEGITGGSVKG